MKITQVDIYLSRSGKLHPIIAEVITDEGISGIGEAGVAYGRGAHAAAGMLKDLAPDLIGRDPARIEAFSTHVYDHTFWAKGGGTIVFAALSALEQALWDIKGRAYGLPSINCPAAQSMIAFAAMQTAGTKPRRHPTNSHGPPSVRSPTATRRSNSIRSVRCLA